MKKILLASFTVFIIMIGGVTHAEVGALPNAGTTPNSPFYFLDRFAERVQEILTFNPEAKAKLQLRFAGERIAEIKYMVENDKVDIGNNGIEKAKGLLLANVAEAATIIQDQKNEGKDVTKLASDINTAFNSQEQLLIQTFQDARKKLNKDRKELLAKSGVPTPADVAKASTGVAPQDTIDTQVKALATQADNLKSIQDEIDAMFTVQQTKIVGELSPKEKKEHEQRSDKNRSKNKKEDSEIEEGDGNDSHKKQEVEKESEKPEAEQETEKPEVEQETDTSEVEFERSSEQFNRGSDYEQEERGQSDGSDD